MYMSYMHFDSIFIKLGKKVGNWETSTGRMKMEGTEAMREEQVVGAGKQP